MEKITEKEQINWVKQELLFLKDYVAKTHYYQMLEEQLQVDYQVQEDDLLSYLHYTRSIVSATKQARMRYEPVLEAMQMQYQSKQQADYAHKRSYVLLQAMNQLPKKEKDLLGDIYIRQLDKKTIYRHQGEIVESTYYRRMNRACLHLFSYLKGSFLWTEKDG